MKIAVKFSSHAAEKMRSRRVQISDVLATLRSPDETYRDIEHNTLIGIKQVNAKFIILIYKAENNRAKVITLFYTTKLDKLFKAKAARGAWKRTK